MSEERELREDEAEDVEAHKKVMAASDEGGDEESDDVEAHQRRAQQHRSN
jgi:hypothetical protein